MADVFALLPRFSWRDKEYPITSHDVSFAHEGAQHRLSYKENGLVEQLGPHSPTFRYGLAMREDIAVGPYKNLFTVGLAQLYADFRNRERGILIDPVYGLFVCVPTSFQSTSDPEKRDGVDVSVEFLHSPDIDAIEGTESQLSPGALSSDAGALDEELQGIDWEQEPSPEPTADPIDAITGVGSQIENNANKISASLDAFAYRCEKAEQQIDRLENGAPAWPLQRALRRNRYNAIQAKKRLSTDPTKKVISVTNSYERPLSVVANEAGMDLVELLRLNPSLARSPFAPAGAVIQIVKRN
jgi:hypothetical protein